MGKPHSLDLRERVVAAVEREGMSHHQAAARFGVATGSVAPGKDGRPQAQDAARSACRVADRPLPGEGLHHQPVRRAGPRRRRVVLAQARGIRIAAVDASTF